MDNLPRDFKGIWIPREIWLHEDLSYLEKLLWAEIDSLDRPETGCTASNDYFCKFFKVKERSIRDAISTLKKKGCVYEADFDGRIRTLMICKKDRQADRQADRQKNAGLDGRKMPVITPGHISIESKEEILIKAAPLSDFLHKEILKVKPNFSKTPSVSWLKNCARLLKLRKEEELQRLIVWALRDSFWMSNVFSPGGILKNLDKLEAQMNNKSGEKWKKPKSQTRLGDYNPISSVNGIQEHTSVPQGLILNMLK